MAGSCSAPAIVLTICWSWAAAFRMFRTGSAVVASYFAFAASSRLFKSRGSASNSTTTDSGSLPEKSFFRKSRMVFTFVSYKSVIPGYLAQSPHAIDLFEHLHNRRRYQVLPGFTGHHSPPYLGTAQGVPLVHGRGLDPDPGLPEEADD